MRNCREFNRWLRTETMLVPVALVLAGCGGGGTTLPSSTTPPVTQPQATTPPVTTPTALPPVTITQVDRTPAFLTTEFNQNWGLAAIGAQYAYGQGYTGSGITIGFVDMVFHIDWPTPTSFSSLDLSYGELSRPMDLSYYKDLYEKTAGEALPTQPHGTVTALIAAGRKNDQYAHGVAFNATVLAVNMLAGVDVTEFHRNGVRYLISDAWGFAARNGARILSNSMGYDDDSGTLEPVTTSVPSSLTSEPTIYTVAPAFLEAIYGSALVVSAAGNRGDPEPSLSNLDAIEEMRVSGALQNGPGAYLIVGSINKDRTISSFSDRAGTGLASDYYLVAPGEDVVTQYPGNDGYVAIISGTSFSAPHVAGAAALLMQRWPSKTAKEIATILLDTAEDLGAPGKDPIYGRGLLSVRNAMQPQGALLFAADPALALAGSSLQLSAAFGDAPALTQALREMSIVDRYQRDFAIDATGLLSTAPARVALTGWRRLMQSFAEVPGGGASVRLGKSLSFSFDLRQPMRLVDGIAIDAHGQPWHRLAGYAFKPARAQVSAQFAGHFAGFDVVTNTGGDLLLALDPGVRLWSLTGNADGLLPRAETARSLYGRIGRALGPATRLTFGWQFVDGNEHARQAAANNLRQDDSSYTMFVSQIEHGMGAIDLSLRAGLWREQDSVLGARSAGGIAFGPRSHSGFVTSSAGWQVAPNLRLHLAASAVRLAQTQPLHSLYSQAGAILASSYAFNLAGTDLFRKGDAFQFSIRQPLRVERGSITMATAARAALDDDRLLHGERSITLQPSGREIAFEAAYETTYGAWLASGNLAYQRDASHVAGQNEASLAVMLRRRF